MKAESGQGWPGTSGGSWYTWWRGDPLPVLPVPGRFHVEVVTEQAQMAALTHLDEAEARERFAQGHQAYAAYVNDALAGWGWSAAHEAHIGELGLALRMPPGNRYLWSFETVAEWRGQGIYPLLLQHILRGDIAAERFWIGHEPGNMASTRGILKAGFEHLGDITILPGSEMLLVATSGNAERVRAGAAILGADVA